MNVTIVEYDIILKKFRNQQTGEEVDLNQLLQEGWIIQGQSSIGDKIIYTLLKSNTLLEDS